MVNSALYPLISFFNEAGPPQAVTATTSNTVLVSTSGKTIFNAYVGSEVNNKKPSTNLDYLTGVAKAEK